MTHNKIIQTRRLMVWACALSALGAAGPQAKAQDNPLSGKQIRLVAPFSPGGGVDSSARGLADGLQRNTGLSVSGYDPYKDFAPVAYLSSFPYIFVTPGDSKFTQLKEVTAQMRSQPGSVSWAFGGNGTLGHFLGVANEVIANYPSIVGFVALYAPAHTPARQLEQLIREVNKVVTSEEYTKRLDRDGSTAKAFGSASEAKDFFDKEGPKWEALTVEAGLKVE